MARRKRRNIGKAYTFDEWKAKVNEIFLRRVYCDWASLAGDKEPLQEAYDRGRQPEEFVQWFIDKYDLDDTPIDRPPWETSWNPPPQGMLGYLALGVVAFLLYKRFRQ